MASLNIAWAVAPGLGPRPYVADSNSGAVIRIEQRRRLRAVDWPSRLSTSRPGLEPCWLVAHATHPLPAAPHSWRAGGRAEPAAPPPLLLLMTPWLQSAQDTELMLPPALSPGHWPVPGHPSLPGLATAGAPFPRHTIHRPVPDRRLPTTGRGLYPAHRWMGHNALSLQPGCSKEAHNGNNLDQCRYSKVDQSRYSKVDQPRYFRKASPGTLR